MTQPRALDIERRIAERWWDGTSVCDIAEQVGLTDRIVYRVLDRLGIRQTRRAASDTLHGLYEVIAHQVRLIDELQAALEIATASK